MLELPVDTLLVVTDDVTVRDPFIEADTVTVAVSVFEDDVEPVFVFVLNTVFDTAAVLLIDGVPVLVFDGAVLRLIETDADCVFDCKELPLIVYDFTELCDDNAEREYVLVELGIDEPVIVGVTLNVYIGDKDCETLFVGDAL